MKNLFLFIAFLNSCVCTAQEVERMPVVEDELTEQEVSFARGVASLDQEPMLYGGRPVEEGELLPNVNVGFCSVTIVGPETIVSAGHCHKTGSAASFVFKGTKYSAKCTRHPQYNDRTLLNDFALCKFSPKGDFPAYGSLGVYPVAAGDVIVMAGYGRGSSNGKLHVGKMPIARIRDQEIFTEGAVVLGSGDSGGSAYLDMQDLKKGPFKVVSVNSRAGGNMSILNMTGDSRAQEFFKSWAQSNNTEICGINKDCLGGVVPPPPPPPEPEVPGFCWVEKRLYELTLAKALMFKNKMMDCAK